jgi:hypothetical protein
VLCHTLPILLGKGEYVGHRAADSQLAWRARCELYNWHMGIRQIEEGQQSAGKTELLLKRDAM